MKLKLALIVLVLISVRGEAVMLDSTGYGQVLLYPYISADNQQDTLIQIVSESGSAHAVKVRVRGTDGEIAAIFNLYLAPK